MLFIIAYFVFAMIVGLEFGKFQICGSIFSNDELHIALYPENTDTYTMMCS